MVVVFGYEMLREVLVTRGDEFTDRGSFPLTEKANQNLGLFMSNGAAWVQMRRFTLATLRDFGMGKRGLEEQVQEETGLLLQELARTKGGHGGWLGGARRGSSPHGGPRTVQGSPWIPARC